ncbi:hypothetical protein NIES25_04920 [Nostoc linckia NIES-25]|nr:hypothetical protein NIES25_04920 [Nostoc linckia NIES-25]
MSTQIIQSVQKNELFSEMSGEEAATLSGGSQWNYRNFASPEEATAFLNRPPVQRAGEISATARNDGTVGVFYFL